MNVVIYATYKGERDTLHSVEDKFKCLITTVTNVWGGYSGGQTGDINIV